MNVLAGIPDEQFISTTAAGVRNVGTVPREIAGVMSVLLHLIDQRGPIVVHFSSATHGEGTTTIAREVSAAASHWDWCKTALVDATPPPDGRNGPMTLGLLDVALDAPHLPFRRRVFDGAVLMEAALSGTNASIPRVDTVRTLFDRLRKEFTLVIVDSPPVLVSQQMAAFSSAADCVVLVVEAERTRAADLERARAMLEQLGARILGIVFNKRRYWVPRIMAGRIAGQPS